MAPPPANGTDGVSAPVRDAALSAALSIPEARGGALPRLLPFLVAPEPIIEDLPYCFLPGWARGSVAEEALRGIAVAGKLVYAQVRWLDDLADAAGPPGPQSSVHRLNETIEGLVRATFSEVVDGTPAGLSFFSVLARLYARYAASLALDNRSLKPFAGPVGLDDYVEQAKARAAPGRAPVDAVLLFVGAADDEIERARSCFELTAAGLQLYDDALDVEEDFKDRRLSWIVDQTLHAIREEDGSSDDPEPNSFYEKALKEGFLVRGLAAAEDLFERSRALATPGFPIWADYQAFNLQRVRSLKDDLQALTVRRISES